MTLIYKEANKLTSNTDNAIFVSVARKGLVHSVFAGPVDATFRPYDLARSAEASCALG